ncbi:VOC family protein [Variovorax sp. KK3]|uniref:VOC family protein n=1 Tax=Variovorax sp. KK3 TaxID=1855728 RepID=UPI00097C0643|nr:VOC family protein [Variovorax sp. KK3]
MSALFGPIRQMGYVVPDIHAAMRHWTEVLRVGPFFHLPETQIIDFRYRGKPSDMRISAGFAQCGPVQIELIQQLNDAPSMYRDFTAAGHTGLQHIAFWVDEQGFDDMLAKAETAGFRVAMSGASVEPAGRLVYFEQEAHPGTVVELSCLTAAKRKVFDMVADAAVDWDGRDPIRTITLGGHR